MLGKETYESEHGALVRLVVYEFVLLVLCRVFERRLLSLLLLLLRLLACCERCAWRLILLTLLETVHAHCGHHYTR